MPSFEWLLSDDTGDSFAATGLPFTVLRSQPPESHRDPSLFQEYFARCDRGRAALYHVGHARGIGWFTAIDVLEMEEVDGRGWERFRIHPAYQEGMLAFLATLLQRRGQGRLLVTSDIQCGPRQWVTRERITGDALRHALVHGWLHLNALYDVQVP
jgi:hypothetical protein